MIEAEVCGQLSHFLCEKCFPGWGRQSSQPSLARTHPMIKKTPSPTDRQIAEPLLHLISAGAGGTTKGGDVPVITGLNVHRPWRSTL